MNRPSPGIGVAPDTVFVRRSRLWLSHAPFTGAEGALIYVKIGGLAAPFLVPEP